MLCLYSLVMGAISVIDKPSRRNTPLHRGVFLFEPKGLQIVEKLG